MDLFDLGEGFSSLSEGVARIQCPTLVGTRQRAMEAFSFFFFFLNLLAKTLKRFCLIKWTLCHRLVLKDAGLALLYLAIRPPRLPSSPFNETHLTIYLLP